MPLTVPESLPIKRRKMLQELLDDVPMSIRRHFLSRRAQGGDVHALPVLAVMDFAFANSKDSSYHTGGNSSSSSSTSVAGGAAGRPLHDQDSNHDVGSDAETNVPDRDCVGYGYSEGEGEDMDTGMAVDEDTSKKRKRRDEH
jgi:hypothetical protein